MGYLLMVYLIQMKSENRKPITSTRLDGLTWYTKIRPDQKRKPIKKTNEQQGKQHITVYDMIRKGETTIIETSITIKVNKTQK